MAISLIDPKTGQVYEAADEAAAKAQQQAYGLELATPEQVSHYDAVKAQSEQPLAGRARAASTAALATGARLVEGAASAIEGATGFGTAPGLVPEQGSETTAEAIAPSAFTPDAKAAREAFPGSAMAGAVAPALGLGAALAPVSGGSSLGLLATEGVVGGTLGEAGEAALMERPMTAEGVLKNGALGLALAGVGTGISAAYRALTPKLSVLAESAERAIGARLPRSIVNAGEDLADPEVAARASGLVTKQTDETLSKLDAAVDKLRPSVANNPMAQKEALKDAAESLKYTAPELSAELTRLTGVQRTARFEGLTKLQGATPDVQSLLDSLTNDASLWGQKAVDHAQGVAAARASRGVSPASYADALRSVDDPAVQRLVNELDDHLDAAGTIDAAQAFRAPRPKRSVGAAAGELSGTEYDDAIKEISDGKLKPEAVQVVADIAPGKRALMSHDVADSLNTIDEVLKQDVSFGTKLEDFAEGAKALTPKQLEAQQGWVAEQATRGRAIADEISSEAAKTVGTGLAYDTKGLGVDAVSKIQTGLSRIEAATDAGVRNMEADLFKREVDSLVKRVGRAKTIDESTQRWLMEKLRPYADSLRDGLQNPDLFGKNAELQQAINAGWHQLIEPYSRVQKQLSDLLGQEYGAVGASAINRRANAGAIERTMATNKGKEFFDDMKESLEGLDQIANARAEFGLSKLDRIDEMRAAIQNVRDQYNTATMLRIAEKKAGVPARLSTGELAGDVGLDVLGTLSPRAAAAVRLGKNVKKLAQAAQDVDLTSLQGTTTGRVIESNLQRFASTQKNLLSDTSFTREMLPDIRLRNALTKVGAVVASGAGLVGALGYSNDASAAQLLQRESDADLEATARALSDADYAERYVSRAGAQPGTTEQFQGVHDTMLQAYQEKRDLIESALRDPEALIDQFAKVFGDLPDDLRSSIGLKAFQVAQYLQSKLPPVRGASVTRPRGLPPSGLEMRKFALQFMAATDPSTVFDDAKRGQLRHEQVETLKDMWPEQYEALRSKTLVAMGQGKSSIVQRQRADLLFDFAGALDPAFSKRLSALAAQEYQKREQPAPTALTSTKRPGAIRPGGLNALSLGAAGASAQ